MKNIIRTQYEVFKWFDEYQGLEDSKKMTSLYSKLIDEEVGELKESLENKDLKEFIDAVGDIQVVCLGLMFFSGEQSEKVNINMNFSVNTFISLCDFDGDFQDVMADLLNIINDSNFTKEKAGQKDGEKQGKIIKGDNFVEPDIDSLIKKYNITFKKDVLINKEK